MSIDKTTARRTRVKGVPGVYRSISGAYEIAYRDSDGRLRWEVVKGSLEDAKSERARVVARKASGERVAPSRVTFEEYGRLWLSTLTVREGTLTLYRGHFERHLVPAFGKKKLSEITVDHVAALIAKLSRPGYDAHGTTAKRAEAMSPYTIRGILTPLSRIFRHAERAGMITSSPVRKLDASERPASTNGERHSIGGDEITKLMGAVPTHRPLIAVGAFAGLRLSEALGLTWADVNFDEGYIHVRKQLGRDGFRAELKTPKARRDVVLIPQVSTLLKAHRMASPYKAASDFVFAGPGGKGRDHRSTARVIQRIVDKAKLEDVSYHTLRHAFASMLIIGLKQDVETVSRQLGHANSSITLRIYSHEFDRARNADQLRDALEGEFGRVARPQAV